MAATPEGSVKIKRLASLAVAYRVALCVSLHFAADVAGMMKAIIPGDESRDQDKGKGALEQNEKNQGGNTSMWGQLGHRDEDAELKNADSDLSG